MATIKQKPINETIVDDLTGDQDAYERRYADLLHCMNEIEGLKNSVHSGNGNTEVVSFAHRYRKDGLMIQVLNLYRGDKHLTVAKNLIHTLNRVERIF